MSTERITMLIRWIEENPGALKGVKRRLNSLEKSHRQAAQYIRDSAPGLQKQNELLAANTEVWRKKRIEILSTANKGFAAFNAATKQAEFNSAAVQRQMTRLTRRMGFVGVRLGWLGFRMVIMGKMLLRWLVDPIKRAVDAMLDWEKNLERVAMAMGLVAAFGDATEEQLDFLREVMVKLVEIGPALQGAFLYLLAALINLALEAGPSLIQFFYDLAEWIIEITPFVRDTLVPAFEEMFDVIRDAWPDLKEFIELFLPGFVEGFKEMVPLIVEVVGQLGPFAPLLGRAAGWAAALSPVLIVLGMAMYLLSPAIAGLSSLFGLFKGPLIAVATKLGLVKAAGASLSVALGPLAVAIAAVSYAVLGLVAWWDEIVEQWNLNAGPAIARLLTALGNLTGAGEEGIDMWKALKIATFPVYMLFQGIIEVIEWLVDRITDLVYWVGTVGKNIEDLGVVLGITHSIIEGILGAVNGLANAFKAAISPAAWQAEDAINGFTGSLYGSADAVQDYISQMCIPHTMQSIAEETITATEKINDFNKVLGESQDDVAEYIRTSQEGEILKQERLDAAAGIGGEGGGAEGPANITIEAPITIESISGFESPEEIAEYISEILAESARRVRPHLLR